MMLLSSCGIDCGACPLKEKCGGGCQVCGGKPFYIKDFGVEVCPIYHCSVEEKGYKTCAECQALPCQLFYDWKDPSMTEEEHCRAIDSNVALLRKTHEENLVILNP